MRGEAAGARGKGAKSGSNYPAISAAYWLPPSNPTPYHVPGSMFAYHSTKYETQSLITKTVYKSAIAFIFIEFSCLSGL
ncbi:unnamed protein product [Pieris macdunnoughi]|uniref:Uncharacterized protein n=1 Tax=Pieris macdunnoughi TaxID=345717 RepID=A0A821USV5_9NEOP|nr:unnamed protein product [Pieris macdunnoughi]